MLLRSTSLLALPLLLLAAPAFADAIPMDRAVCDGKAAGDRCQVGEESGVCATSTCSRLDYSQGIPPRSVEYECLVCGPPPGEASGAHRSENPAPNERTAAGSPTSQPTGVDTSDRPRSRGCDVGGVPLGGVASVVMGGALLFRLRRRRAR